MLGICRLTHREAYFDMFMVSVAGPLLALAVVLVSHASQHLPLLAAVLEDWGAWIGLSVTAALLVLYAVSRWYLPRPLKAT